LDLARDDELWLAIEEAGAIRLDAETSLNLVGNFNWTDSGYSRNASTTASRQWGPCATAVGVL
jgi:hypothetical protein